MPITSVDFSPDGKTIVSGSRDQTLKVWGFRPFLESEWEEVDISAMPKDSDGEVEIDGLGYISSNYWRNVVTGDKAKNKPSGGACRRHDQSLMGFGSRKSAEAVVQDHGAVRTVGLATSGALTGDREDACSISAVACRRQRSVFR